MTEVMFVSDSRVDLDAWVGSDEDVVRVARVSTVGNGVPKDTDVERFIRFLMRDQHGTPFEHNSFRFRITTPIFVWREFMRHRIASYNEESGRYKKLEPEFYTPPTTRALVQTGKPGEYKFSHGTWDQLCRVAKVIREASVEAYEKYEEMLEAGIAREVARMVLPVNIMSTAYVTMNARALMNFLQLRMDNRSVDLEAYQAPESAVPTFPQWEIARVAWKMFDLWYEKMPITATAFLEKGRIAP